MADAQVTLREVNESDFADMVRWMNGPEVLQFVGAEAGQVTLEVEQQRYAEALQPDYKHWRRSIEIEGRHVGRVSLSFDRTGKSGDLGVCIGEQCYWGKGYGTAVMAEVLRIGFAELGLNRISLWVFARNLRAIRCYEKCGFRHEGLHRQSWQKAGKWIDVISMAILREEWQAQQETPEGIHVREFRWSDFEDVLAVWGTGLGMRATDNAEEMAKILRRDRDLFLVACDGERVIGSVIGGWDGWRGTVWRMVVHPDYRRRGVGRMLLEELHARLKAKGALRVMLGFHLVNETAYAFYRSMGYEHFADVGMMARDFADLSYLQKCDER